LYFIVFGFYKLSACGEIEMAKQQWQRDYDILKAELDGLCLTTNNYVGLGPTVGLFDLYKKIGRKAEQISKLIEDNREAWEKVP
jgi:hypothetical protein